MYPKIKYDDKRYISRGKFYVLHLDSEIMSQGIDKLNDNKVGAPFVYSDNCFMAIALFRLGHMIQMKILSNAKSIMSFL